MNNPRADGFLVVGGYTLKIERFELTDEFKEIARKELRETPEVTDAAVATLKEMVRGLPNFYMPEDRDDFFVSVLRACKFYPEPAFELMKRFFTFKMNNPKICEGLSPSREKNALEQNLMTIVPKRDRHGRRTIIIEAGHKWDPRECSVHELLRGMLVMVMACHAEPQTQIAGGIVIVDVKGLSLSHVLQFTPNLARNLVYCLQRCVPVRLQAIHIINQSFFLNMVYSIFKPFLDEKLRERIHFHGEDREMLRLDIGPKSLPMKYGGDMDLPDIPGKMFYELLSHYEEHYEEIQKLGFTSA